jgi:phosphatidylserine/phosphatidylglycerophosphate/cardiolipin synthase-like enzyme
MKRSLLAVVAKLGVVLGPIAAAGGPLPSSMLTQAYVEPAAGYGFFSSVIASAHHHIDLSTYEFKDRLIGAQLVAKARTGVRVRVVLNADYY